MLLPLFLALLAAQAPATPPPLPAADAADGRCMVVFAALGSRLPPEQRPMLQQGVMYFAGKLRGRTASIDVAQTLVRAGHEAQAAHLSPQTDLVRCRDELQAVSTSLGRIRAVVNPSPAPTPHRP
ncbi:hypothetical protein [Sphingomonas sp.]|uniref:hypothetical protein n=1 Tax=Sphingomonas sp. TaxID=28214 RepID=UPI003CC58A8A